MDKMEFSIKSILFATTVVSIVFAVLASSGFNGTLIFWVVIVAWFGTLSWLNATI